MCIVVSAIRVVLAAAAEMAEDDEAHVAAVFITGFSVGIQRSTSMRLRRAITAAPEDEI